MIEKKREEENSETKIKEVENFEKEGKVNSLITKEEIEKVKKIKEEIKENEISLEISLKEEDFVKKNVIFKKINSSKEKTNPSNKQRKKFVRVTDSESSQTIDCFLCSKSIFGAHWIEHLKTCYEKLELKSQRSNIYNFGETYFSFCNFYDPKEKSFCKREKESCPFHQPSIKNLNSSRGDLCGFFSILSNNGMKNTCKVPKKDCLKHVGWELMMVEKVYMRKSKAILSIVECKKKLRQIVDNIYNREQILQNNNENLVIQHN